MATIKKIAIGFSLILILTTLFVIRGLTPDVSPEQPTPEVGSQEISLLTQTNSQGGISFEVTPIDFSFENPVNPVRNSISNGVKFEIKMDTHSGSLDFDLVKISFLEDDKGNKYQPLEWQGSPPGGHHLAGILIFPRLNSQTKKISLIIQDNLSRVFEWDLK